MSVKKVRHAQRECLSERVTWFACADVGGKGEMCAEKMPYKAQEGNCLRTCREKSQDKEV